MNILKVPFHTAKGELQLNRYPLRKNDKLQAWDAADEYLLHHVSEQKVTEQVRVLVINDSFGALSVALASGYPEIEITAISDSWLSHCGTLQNLQCNQLANESIQLRSSLDWPETAADLVLIKIPKSLSLLEDQLHRLRPLLNKNTVIVAADMAKNIHNSTLALFEKLIGPTKTSLAKKKARLVFATSDLDMADTANPYPKNPYPKYYSLPGMDYQISNHANVFSREKLDIGSRFLIKHIPANKRYQRIVDLGCGNGLLGIVAAQSNSQAELLFVDESFMAVASAQQNFAAIVAAHAPQRSAQFSVTDCLQGQAKGSADLILNNPPFHQQKAVSSHIAEQMFRESKSVLKTGGEFWVVGNRHLQYHQKLERLFGNCQTIASNSKFVILKVIKR